MHLNTSTDKTASRYKYLMQKVTIYIENRYHTINYLLLLEKSVEKCPHLTHSPDIRQQRAQ